MPGGFYGDIYKKDRTVLVSSSNQKELQEEIDIILNDTTDKDVIVTAKMCFDDETGCMELETK